LFLLCCSLILLIRAAASLADRRGVCSFAVEEQQQQQKQRPEEDQKEAEDPGIKLLDPQVAAAVAELAELVFHRQLAGEAWCPASLSRRVRRLIQRFLLAAAVRLARVDWHRLCHRRLLPLAAAHALQLRRCQQSRQQLGRPARPAAKLPVPEFLRNDADERRLLQAVAGRLLDSLDSEAAALGRCLPVRVALTDLLARYVLQPAMDSATCPEVLARLVSGHLAERSRRIRYERIAAGSFEDFVRQILQCESAPALRQLRASVRAEILHASALRTLQRQQQQGAQAAVQYSSKAGQLMNRDLRRYLNQLGQCEALCQQRLAGLLSDKSVGVGGIGDGGGGGGCDDGSGESYSREFDDLEDVEAERASLQVYSLQVILEHEAFRAEFRRFVSQRQPDEAVLLDYWAAAKRLSELAAAADCSSKLALRRLYDEAWQLYKRYLHRGTSQLVYIAPATQSAAVNFNLARDFLLGRSLSVEGFEAIARDVANCAEQFWYCTFVISPQFENFCRRGLTPDNALADGDNSSSLASTYLSTSASLGTISASVKSTSASSGMTSASVKSTSASVKSTSASSGMTSASVKLTSASSGMTSASVKSTSASSGMTSASVKLTSASSGTTSASVKSTSASSGMTSASVKSTSTSSGMTSASVKLTSTSSGTTSASVKSTSASSGMTSASSEMTSASFMSTSVSSGMASLASAPAETKSSLPAASSAALSKLATLPPDDPCSDALAALDARIRRKQVQLDAFQRHNVDCGDDIDAAVFPSAAFSDRLAAELSGLHLERRRLIAYAEIADAWTERLGRWRVRLLTDARSGASSVRFQVCCPPQASGTESEPAGDGIGWQVSVSLESVRRLSVELSQLLSSASARRSSAGISRALSRPGPESAEAYLNAALSDPVACACDSLHRLLTESAYTAHPRSSHDLPKPPPLPPLPVSTAAAADGLGPLCISPSLKSISASQQLQQQQSQASSSAASAPRRLLHLFAMHAGGQTTAERWCRDLLAAWTGPEASLSYLSALRDTLWPPAEAAAS
uniref:RGS domain-containing protein n=1 Tax=Macrostomum lignano TaxID=282301 RepID=A0A1I8G377_9PLAT